MIRDSRGRFATKKENSEGAHSRVASGQEIKIRAADVDLPAWLEATAPPKYQWRQEFQDRIYRALKQIDDGSIRRLMLFVPPRHGKSEMVTIRYAAWRLLRDPKLRIVVASYNQKLANKFSRRIQAICSPGRKKVKAHDSLDLAVSAVDEWETAEGGGVKAVGVGAGITGFGADLIIIDDPIKGRADAESANNRDHVWEWFNDDLMTRLEPNGAVILIQTRWHEDDLAGRLIKANPGCINRQSPTKHEWNALMFPALAEYRDSLGRSRGGTLWNDRFSKEDLLRKKAQMGSYSFAALYQQSPIPTEGALFKREWFTRIVDAAPPGLRWTRGYDLAVSVKKSADYTASFRVALDKKTGDLYIADGFRKRIEFPEQRRYIIGRIHAERDTEHGIEEALHGAAFVQELMREEKISGAAFRGVRVKGDKYTRALAWAGRAESGKVVLVRGGWIDDFLEEICRFPHAAHDDQVDAVSLAVGMMELRRKTLHFF